ncbi:MAG: carbohydrate ABC transporter permease [Clostridia bacterium]|nr:carbohydrate ABC transporter permease [Clostridia bacterium]
MTVKLKKTVLNILFYTVVTMLAAVFIAPIIIVLYNSFKGRLYISSSPFSLPGAESFLGIQNYITGINRTGFFKAFGYSLFITVASVFVIVLFCSMAAWYLVRQRGKLTNGIYYAFIFSMIVPFQMVMFTMSKVANIISLDNPLGIVVIYLGFGSGLSVFMFYGFAKSIPMEIEEAATIDGCGPVSMFFKVILPMLRPMATTVAILNAMWIWNDYLLPYLVIGNNYRTIPIAVQYLEGGYGSRDIGALMALLVISIIPIIVFYLVSQKQIIKGVAAGAVKG